MLSTPPTRLGFFHASNGSTIPDTDEDGNVVYPEAKLEIENGLHQLETLLESTVDKAFDKFEIYVLRNILTVPEDLLGWIRLKHYEVCRLAIHTRGRGPRLLWMIFAGSSLINRGGLTSSSNL